MRRQAARSKSNKAPINELQLDGIQRNEIAEGFNEVFGDCRIPMCRCALKNEVYNDSCYSP